MGRGTWMGRLNPINESGKGGEDKFQELLDYHNIPYKRAKTGQSAIDFIINPNGQKQLIKYVDIKNQNVGGSVVEKIPHTIWKYKRLYDYEEVYIVEGEYDIDKNVREHCSEICKTHFVKLDEMVNILLNVPLYKNDFF